MSSCTTLINLYGQLKSTSCMTTCPHRSLACLLNDVTSSGLILIQFLTENLLDAVQLATAQLSVQSILLITVDVEPPDRPEDGLTKWNPTTWMRHYRRRPELTSGAASPGEILPEMHYLTERSYPEAAIDEGLRERNATFIGMFSFLYADGIGCYLWVG